MSQENVLYFDEMNLPQAEIQKRISACNSLEVNLIHCFEWIENYLDETEEEESVFSLFGSRVRNVFIAWAVSIELFSEQELIALAAQLYQDTGLNVYDVIGTVEDEQAEAEDNSFQPTIFLFGSSLYLEKLEEVKKYIEDVDRLVENTSKHIEESYYISEKRARRIAQDETNKRFNKMWHIENTAGYQYHKWVACNDKYTRDSHSDVSGQIKPVDEPFEVNGYLMMYPMDESYGVPIDEIAGCRCSEEFL